MNWPEPDREDAFAEGGVTELVELGSGKVLSAVGELRLRNRVSAASAAMTAVIVQPFSRSTGPKSAAGISGPGLIPGTERAANGSSVAVAVTRPIVGCAG